MTGFYVYIDESGDEGFVFAQPNQGSSHWFVISAVVTRTEYDHATVRLVDEIRTELKRGQRDALHFRKLKHEHRLPFVAKIASTRLRTISVCVHKPSIPEPEKFMAEPHLLYRYATRYLLERVSWLCRDSRKEPTHAAKVIFSNRSCMSYEDLRGYLGLLRDKTNDLGVQIDWSVIDPDEVEARTHDSYMGLQIADAVASSWYYGLQPSPHGFVEPRYAQMLKPVVYHHQGHYLGYGLKFWPVEAEQILDERAELHWLGAAGYRP